MSNIYKDAVTRFGERAQIDLCIEECAELTSVFIKYRRGRDDVGIRDIASEIADVEIMCAEMREIFGDELVEYEKQKKLIRLQSRIRG